MCFGQSAIVHLMGRQTILKWSYLIIFMRVLVAVSVRWCIGLKAKNGYAWVFIGNNGIRSHPPTYTLIANRLLMRFMTQAMNYTMVLTKV